MSHPRRTASLAIAIIFAIFAGFAAAAPVQGEQPEAAPKAKGLAKGGGVLGCCPTMSNLKKPPVPLCRRPGAVKGIRGPAARRMTRDVAKAARRWCGRLSSRRTASGTDEAVSGIPSNTDMVARVSNINLGIRDKVDEIRRARKSHGRTPPL